MACCQVPYAGACLAALLCCIWPSLNSCLHARRVCAFTQLSTSVCRVFAFEPLAANTVALRRSLCTSPARSRHVTLFDVALGAAAARDCMLVSGLTNKGDGHLACDKPPGWVPAPGYMVRPGSPEFARLDDLFGDAAEHIGCVNLDVEARPASGVQPCVKVTVPHQMPVCVH